ncbi:MAG TPA: adenosylcobinamide-GDP ribazoletransferase, partial [Spirochaetes bacterium]|nr:adenosylcobinamide-GDP ribazoletransferase [Spirochaetota bacterium]
SLSAWVLLTGGLHLDGLADTCDGVFSLRPRERVLEIMKDPRIGTNGVLAVVMILAAKFTALLSLEESRLITALIVSPVAGRLALVTAASLGKYARDEEGLGSFVNHTGWRQFLPALALALPVLPLDPGRVTIAAGSALFVPLAMHFYLKRKLGGVTGDTLGACVELTETWTLWAFLIMERLL